MIRTVILTLLVLFALVAGCYVARFIGWLLKDEARRYYDAYYK